METIFKRKHVVKGQSSFLPGPAETQVRAESSLLSGKVSFVTFYAKIFVRIRTLAILQRKKYHIELFIQYVSGAL